MKTKTYQVYQFDELNDKAKQKAKDDYAAIWGFCWADEYKDSLKALAEHFGGKLADWQIDWFNGSYSSAKFAMPDEGFAYEEGENAQTEEARNAAKLAELGAFDPVTLKGTGACKLTGFCADESAIDGFRAAWHKGERNLDKLMQAAFVEWLKDGQADCTGFYEDAQFSEHCEVNELEFTDDGAID